MDKHMEYRIPMGQCDIPLSQKQPVYYLEPWKYHTAVFGGSMSGKTTFIKTLLVRLHERKETQPEEEIYLIDFSGNIGDYANLSNVCACFDNSNEENIKRVFKTVEKRLEENSRVLGSSGYYQMAVTDVQKVPSHLFLIIENITAFLSDERYESYREKLFTFCRDGLSKGLTVVFTAGETYGLGRMLTYFGQKIAFNMPADSYYEIFGTKTLTPMKLPGRGLVNLNTEVYEFQGFLPFPVRDNEQPYLATLINKTQRDNPRKIMAFQDVLTQDNFMENCGREFRDYISEDDIVVGLNYDEHRPISVDVQEHRTIAIYGKKEFGKTNLLTGILKGIVARYQEADFLYLDDGREQLKPFFEQGSLQIKDHSLYFTDVSKFRAYLAENGYGIKAGISGKPVLKEETKTEASQKERGMTVFVLQSKGLYRNSSDAKYLITTGLPGMIDEADANDYVFIFSDIPHISSADITVPLNEVISLAFLLDNVGDFAAERGSGNKSVFGEMDARELKAEYGRCVLGDGYVYNTGKDELEKVKFIKQEI